MKQLLKCWGVFDRLGVARSAHQHKLGAIHAALKYDKLIRGHRLARLVELTPLEEKLLRKTLDVNMYELPAELRRIRKALDSQRRKSRYGP